MIKFICSQPETDSPESGKKENKPQNVEDKEIAKKAAPKRGKGKGAGKNRKTNKKEEEEEESGLVEKKEKGERLERTFLCILAFHSFVSLFSSPPVQKVPKKRARKSPAEQKEPEKQLKEEEKESPKAKEKGSATEAPQRKNPFASFFITSKNKGDDSSKDSDAKQRSPYEALVRKSGYHPIDDAFWKRGEKTPYLAFAKTLQAIEETSGRLKTIEILVRDTCVLCRQAYEYTCVLWLQ